jgi:hypothetical protein
MVWAARLSYCACQHLANFEGEKKSGGSEQVQKVRVPNPLLAKHRIDFPLAAENVLESFIKDKKNTEGLIISGGKWRRATVRRFLRCLPVPIPQANRERVVSFLEFYDAIEGVMAEEGFEPPPTCVKQEVLNFMKRR